MNMNRNANFDDNTYNPFNDNLLSRGGGGGGGNGGNFQMGGGQQRFDGFNNNQFNQNLNNAGGSGGSGVSTSALDVLNKLNNIVAATGGGLSARQIATARQNPVASGRMDMPDNFNNMPSNNFNNGPGLQMPQRRGDMAMNNNINGNGNNGGDILPGDVRFRGNNIANPMNNQLTGSIQ